MMKVGLLAALVAASGCGAVTYHGELQNLTRGDSAFMGLMSRSLEPPTGDFDLHSEASVKYHTDYNFDLTFLGATRGKICFARYYFDDPKYGAEIALKITQDQYKYNIEVHSSVDEVPESRPLVPPDPVWLAEFAVISDTVSSHPSSSHSDASGNVRKTAISICGPAPTIKPDSAYVTVTVQGTGQETPWLLVWKLAGDVAPSAPVEDPTAPSSNSAGDTHGGD